MAGVELQRDGGPGSHWQDRGRSCAGPQNSARASGERLCVLGLSCVKDSTVRSSGDPGRLAAIEPRHTVLPRPATCVLCYSTTGAGDRQVPQRVHVVEKCHGCALVSPACPGHLEAENVVGSH